jgi:hypothetical protein
MPASQRPCAGKQASAARAGLLVAVSAGRIPAMLRDSQALRRVIGEYGRLRRREGRTPQARGQRFNALIADVLKCWGIDAIPNILSAGLRKHLRGLQPRLLAAGPALRRQPAAIRLSHDTGLNPEAPRVTQACRR